MEFYLAGEMTQVIDSIPWVRCASGNVYRRASLSCDKSLKEVKIVKEQKLGVACGEVLLTVASSKAGKD